MYLAESRESSSARQSSLRQDLQFRRHRHRRLVPSPPFVQLSSAKLSSIRFIKFVVDCCICSCKGVLASPPLGFLFAMFLYFIYALKLIKAFGFNSIRDRSLESPSSSSVRSIKSMAVLLLLLLIAILFSKAIAWLYYYLLRNRFPERSSLLFPPFRQSRCCCSIQR